ncbi:MAG: hypothetical protein Q8R10_03770 [Pseudomonas sp.]|uniref:hypothetical protein n=1 Tax=Pseudomonas sp. TaxID=306 RepID=UPI002736E788|nr:hypothetical protein [Pseudomonas sp.]MDP3845525.1 hypothetical protein [Pseudomonas sp.]
MTFRRVPFDGPYCDHAALGFTPPHPAVMNWRARSIVTVCCSPLDREDAIFLNAAGYAVPLEPHPYELRHLLARAVSREYGFLEGLGQFALKPARVSGMASSGQLKRWIIYHLAQPNGYANDPAVWAAHVARELEEERRVIEAGHPALVELYNILHRRQLAEQTSEIALPWPAQAQPQAIEAPDLERNLREGLAARRDELAEHYRQEKAKDDAVAAWLRGDVGEPPLLALMQGAAW